MTPLELVLTTALTAMVVAVCIGVAIGRANAKLWREIHRDQLEWSYGVYNALCQRERQFGRLKERAEGLAEIAATSSLGAQLYQSFMAELRDPPQESP